MGWLFMERPRSVKGYLQSLATFETDTRKSRCLDVAIKLNAAFAAVEEIDKATGDRSVYGVVFLMRYIRGEERFNWGYKSISESCGPVETGCPARILELLTPTEDPSSIEWREKCRNTTKLSMPRVGVAVRFEEPIRFVDGSQEREFTVIQWGRRKKRCRGKTGGVFRISRDVWQSRKWSVIGGNQSCP